MRVGDRLTLVIERPAAGGRMIARHAGGVVFVAGAIPGETVEAEVERVQKGLTWAVTRRVHQPSSDRRDVVSDFECGGCVLGHVRYERQLELKREIIQDAFRHIGHLTLPQPIEVAPSPITGYRTRARLHLRRGRLGFFREGTHELCDPSGTRQLLPEALDAVQRLAAALSAIDPTIEAEVDLAENIPATDRAVHLDIGHSRVGARLAGQLTAIDGLSGASLSLGSEKRIRELCGSPLIADSLAVTPSVAAPRVSLIRHARAFFQGNRFLVEPLAQYVVSAIESGLLIDLYAGVGLFSIGTVIAGRSDHAIAVEGDEVAAGNLRRNAAQCDGGVRVRSESVEAFLARPQSEVAPSTVIVDPPRTGLSKSAIDGILRLGAPRLVYVSCDVATLARDAKRLCENGYRMESARAFDLFPQTAHVETVIVFSR